MGLYSTGGGGGSGFEQHPSGVHMSRCVTVIDCGMQKTTYNGEDKWHNKVWIAFETPSVRVKWTDKDDVEHEGPAIIGNMYTNSLFEKATLCKHLESWRGRKFTKEEAGDQNKPGTFDLFALLDKPCQLNVIHNEKGDKTYANIATIMGFATSMTVPDRETDLLWYTPGDSEASANFDRLPKWLKEKCTFGHRLDETMTVNVTGSLDGPAAVPAAHAMPDGRELPPDFDEDIPY